MEEIKQAPHTLESGQGTEARQVFDLCKDSEYQGNKQDHPQIIRVGNDVLELITIPDTLGRPHTTLVGRTREVIKERYGNSTLTQAPYYDALAVVPSHTDYKQVVGNCWNIYNRLEIEPNKGEHPMWDMLMKRIFGEQEALGWDYLTLLYRNPTQVLPVLCLVSPENHTGKSSFGNALSYLFGANVGFYTQDDLNSTFNGWTSYAATIGNVKFDGCSFGKGQGYAYCRPYAPTEFVNCTFAEGYQIDARAAVSFENCTIGGIALTAENLSTFVTGNLANVTVK
jgi:hypothetical protein